MQFDDDDEETLLLLCDGALDSNGYDIRYFLARFAVQFNSWVLFISPAVSSGSDMPLGVFHTATVP